MTMKGPAMTCRNSILLACLGCLFGAEPSSESRHPRTEATTDARINVFGPFLWARADESGEDVQVSDGRNLLPEEASLDHLLFRSGPGMSRSNLMNLDPDVAYTVQLTSFRLFNPGAHNAKVMVGYMPTTWRFSHGDRKDLVHWADVPRVVLFLPVRHGHGADPERQDGYMFSSYEGQAPCVIELPAGEHIRYEWFSQGRLHPNIICDLHPVLKDVKPAVDRPIFRFEVFPGGRWTLRIETDGRDGLAGGARDGDYDLDLDQDSPGARPYRVDLGAQTQWALTAYNPTAQVETSQICLKVQPFRRSTGEALPALGRLRRLWNLPLAKAAALAADPKAVWKATVPGETTPRVVVIENAHGIRLMNRWTEVLVTPNKGMYLPYARDLATGAEIVNTLKLNFPYFEHGIKESQTAGYRIIRAADGSVTVAMTMRFGHHQGPAESERYGRFSERELAEFVTLRPGSSAVEFRGRVDNPTPLRLSSRLWDRAYLPVPRDRDLRFIMPCSHGVEHSANWIKPWPSWDFEGKTLDFRDARSWGKGRPTQYFALYPAFGFTGAWYPAEGINRLRIGDPARDPGMKTYYAGGEYYELWGGSTGIFEDPGELLDGFVPIDYTKRFYLTTGIGMAAWADERLALSVDTGTDAGARITGPQAIAALRAEILDGERVVAATTGPIGPGQVLAVKAGVAIERFRLRLSSGEPVLLDRVFPLEIPDQGALYDKARNACAAGRIDYEELQEHQNHRGIPTVLNAAGRAAAALAAKPLDPAQLASLANACYRTGDFEQALALANALLAIEPENQHAHHVCGLIAYERSAFDEATSELARAGVQANYLRALLAIAGQKPDGAIGLLRTLVTARPAVFRPRLALAALLARGPAVDEGLALARALLDEHPASIEAAEILSRVATAASQAELAVEAGALRDALLVDNPDAGRQLSLFRAELDHGRWAYPARYRQPLPVAP